MRVVILCGGSIHSVQGVKAYLNGDFVICADSGARHAVSLGVVPDLLLGDFDSIDAETLDAMAAQGVRRLSFPKDKDYTDSELAIEEAIKVGATEILLIAATGTRPDHSLANIFLLRNLVAKGIDARIISGKDEIMLTNKAITLQGSIGDTLSLLALDPKVTGITTQGLKYPLQNETLYNGSSRGISNIFAAEEVHITLQRGMLLLMRTKEECDCDL